MSEEPMDHQPASAPVEQVRLWRVATLPAVELLHARYLTQTFTRHSHDQYAFGVIEQGALGFYYRGATVVAPRGSINLCIPGEVHTGHAAGAEGWQYRMFYFDAVALQQVASAMAGRPRELPFFKAGVIHDDALAGSLRLLHQRLEQPEQMALELESHFWHLLSLLVSRYADDPVPVQRVGANDTAVRQIKAYLEAHYSEDITLDELSRLTHLSRFHLNRLFSAAVGLAPHAYLRQVRIQRAKALLARGEPIATVAAATGFADQSHLTRWFKRLWGVTPGNYRNSVQDGYGKIEHPEA